MRCRTLSGREVSVVGVGCNQFGATADQSAVDTSTHRDTPPKGVPTEVVVVLY